MLGSFEVDCTDDGDDSSNESDIEIELLDRALPAADSEGQAIRSRPWEEVGIRHGRLSRKLVDGTLHAADQCVYVQPTFG